MNPQKIRKLVALNAAIVLANIALFSDAILGLSLLAGSAFSIAAAWTAVLGSVFALIKGNLLILNKPEARLLLQDISSLDSLDNCVSVLEAALNHGDVFDESILQNLEQIKRFRRKRSTIRDILLQKFAENEMSFKRFDGVLTATEEVMCMNMRSILNKISAFDIEEYEVMLKKGFRSDKLSQEKRKIYNEYIAFVNNATNTNEDILLKLDKMLLEISRYNSLDGEDVQKLPAIIEMDELIKNANLYK